MLLIPLVLLLASAGEGSAETPPVIRGVVRDPSGAPVAGAQAVRGNLPSEGAWVMVIRAANLDGGCHQSPK